MKKEEWKGILVYLEIQDSQIAQVSLELLEKARELIQKARQHTDEAPGEICGTAIGSELSAVEGKLANLPLDQLFLYETEGNFQANIWEEAMTDCIQNIKPAIVLVGGTVQGRALAPGVAVSCRTGVTADCTALELDQENQLIQTRPAFGGNIMASILTCNTRPQIATVRPGVFEAVELEGKNQKKQPIIHRVALKSQRRRAVTIDRAETTGEPGIETQDILVVAGRGVKKKEDLNMLQELADLLGGKLASSRALVEKGWMQPKQQIGLSGVTVKPKCILTFGVSGTVQFMAGMKNTPNIIAVNNDPEAKIFEIAHYPICADLYQVVPELIKRLKDGEKLKIIS